MPSTRSACDYLTLKNTRLVFFFKCCFSCKYILLCYKAPVSYFFHSTICLKNLSVLLVAGYVQCSFSDIDNEFCIFAFISPAPCPARKLELSSPHRGLQPRSLSVAPMGCQDVCVGWEVTEFRAPRHNVKRVATCPPARLRALGPPGSLSSPNISIPPLIFYKIPTLLFLHFPP